MSRGLGKTQRLILAVLSTREGGDCFSASHRQIRLPLGVHDMSEVVRIIGDGKGLSERCPRYSSGDKNWLTFRASFSRAARRLVRDGYLDSYGYVDGKLLFKNLRLAGLSGKEQSLPLTAHELEIAGLWNQKRVAWSQQQDERLIANVRRQDVITA
jgi:hypothetical protein